MKKIASYIIIGSMAFSAVSCSDGWLDVEPSTAVELINLSTNYLMWISCSTASIPPCRMPMLIQGD